MHKRFQDINFIKGLVSKLPNRGALDYFREVHEEELMELFRRNKAKVLRYEGRNFCSDCGYGFGIDLEGGDESGYHYCANCLKSLLCCDDEFCYGDTERLEQEINDTLEGFYKSAPEHR